MADPWRADAVCKGLNQDIFFDDIWTNDRVDQYDVDALYRARKLCAVCPVRVGCLSTALKAEAGMAAKFRAGLFAGLTPLQRSSLEKRGWDGVQDPWDFIAGNGVRPIPDGGDDWNERHSRLAKLVVAWMIDNTIPGYAMPRPSVLADTFSVRKADMMRVYESFVEDGTIQRTARSTFARSSSPLTAKAYQPGHLTV